MYDFDISQVIENMINTEETLYELKGHAGKTKYTIVLQHLFKVVINFYLKSVDAFNCDFSENYRLKAFLHVLVVNGYF